MVHPAVAFMHRTHCDLPANAKQFRMPVSKRDGDGLFVRKGKRQTSVARDHMSTLFRGVLKQNGFTPSQPPGSPANKGALQKSMAFWRGHWFFGTVLKTDAQWWDPDKHGMLVLAAEGKGETPEGFLGAIMANQRQQYMSNQRKVALLSAPPVNIFSNSGVQMNHAHAAVSTITIPPHARARSPDADNAFVSAVDQDSSDEDSEDTIRQIVLLKL
jgi:hypothetical protein